MSEPGSIPQGTLNDIAVALISSTVGNRMRITTIRDILEALRPIADRIDSRVLVLAEGESLWRHNDPYGDSAGGIVHHGPCTVRISADGQLAPLMTEADLAPWLTEAGN